MKTLALVLATMMTGCVAMTAQATAPVRKVQQQVVSYADLNLESEFDAGILLIRIRSAARTVCGLRDPAVMPLAILDRLETCSEDAIARAVAEVNAPVLTRRAIRLGVIERPAVVASADGHEIQVRADNRTRM